MHGAAPEEGDTKEKEGNPYDKQVDSQPGPRTHGQAEEKNRT